MYYKVEMRQYKDGRILYMPGRKKHWWNSYTELTIKPFTTPRQACEWIELDKKSEEFFKQVRESQKYKSTMLKCVGFNENTN